MKILVTGGAGFIGSNFIRYWLKNHPNDEVCNLDKLTYAGHISSTKDFKDNPNYTFVKGDICDFKLVDDLVGKTDAIVHFAAESHVDRSIHGPSVFVETNVLGTHVLLESAVKHKVKRFHHVSTDEVFGALKLDSKEKFDEKTPYKPKNPYSASKAGSDHLVRAYSNTFGLFATITNTSNNYGPYQSPEKMIPRMVTNLMEDKKIPIYGDGLYVRDWLYVGDHVSAIERVLEDGKPGDTYLVGGLTEDVNHLELAKKILKMFGKGEEMIEFVKDRPGHDRRYAVDWSKIKKDLDWEPKYSFDEWLEKTVQWYKDNRWWWEELKKEAEEFYKKANK